MRLSLVTETWPPEIDGVAMTVSRLVAALRDRGHEILVIRPRQRHEAVGPDRDEERVQPGVPLPF